MVVSGRAQSRKADGMAAVRLGAKGIWIEDSFTDQISPAHFESLHLGFLNKLIEEIRSLGLKSIYFYCGDPTGKWDLITGIGADAFAFEEGKKGFTIDIEDVVDRVNGGAAVFGNLDAIHTLPNASEDRLRHEIKRQIAAGRKNNNRFVMSIGSPVTPATPVERVRRYVDLVHELADVSSTWISPTFELQISFLYYGGHSNDCVLNMPVNNNTRIV